MDASMKKTPKNADAVQDGFGPAVTSCDEDALFALRLVQAFLAIPDQARRMELILLAEAMSADNTSRQRARMRSAATRTH